MIRPAFVVPQVSDAALLLHKSKSGLTGIEKWHNFDQR
jgi:hypothetical protein